MEADRVEASVIVDVRSEQPGMLVLSEPYYSERHARLDGGEVPIYRANGAFTAVAIPAGHHRVELSYQPTGLYIGAAITTATLIVIGVVLFVDQRRASRRHPPTPLEISPRLT